MSVLIIWIVQCGLFKGYHSDSGSESESESETNIKINSSMGPVAEQIVSVDLEGSCNVVTSIWSVAGQSKAIWC